MHQNILKFNMNQSAVVKKKKKESIGFQRIYVLNGVPDSNRQGINKWTWTLLCGD